MKTAALSIALSLALSLPAVAESGKAQADNLAAFRLESALLAMSIREFDAAGEFEALRSRAAQADVSPLAQAMAELQR